MSKVLKRLYLGDVVKSFGTKQLRKLTTEKPQEDSIIGTWVFNDSLDFSSFSENWYADFNFTNGSTVYPYCGYNHFGENSEYNKLVYYNADGSGITVYKLGSGWVAQAYKTITIETETEDTFFISWLKANATKQESIVGTWRFNNVLVDAISINNNDNKFYLTGDIYCYRNSTTEDRYLDLFEDVTILIRPHDDGVCYFNCQEYAGATARTLYTDGEKGFAGGTISTPDGSMIEYYYTTSSYLLIDKSGEDGKMLRYINIKGGQDVENKTLKAYIKANATKIA